MCQNSGSGMQTSQIQRFVEHGMPEKIIKTVQYTLKKRAAKAEKEAERSGVSKVAFFDSIDTDNSDCETDTLSCAFPCKQSIAQRPVEAVKLRQQSNATPAPPMASGCPRFRLAQEKIANIGASITGDSEKIIQSLNGYADEEGIDIDGKAYVDALAIATQMTKKVFQRLSEKAEEVQHSKYYTLLTKTTQPAHIIAVSLLSIVALTVWPDIIESKKHEPQYDAITGEELPVVGARGQHHSLVVIAYLGAFATHFGSQIWMTFVSGLSLYFSLPRHTFGQCQQILFPKYFALNGVLSIAMLILFAKYFLHTWSIAGLVQVAALASSAAIEMTVRLYLAPPMLRLMHEKYRIEGAVGSGQEVGDVLQGDLVQCPHYQRVHKTFRRIHMIIAIGNMMVLMATCLHLYFLALKIRIS